jgi:methionine sulfoxide reductase catalytic subunit
MPRDKLWISLEEEESFPSLVALPGHKNLGVGRHWHFFSIIFWIGNGAAYYLLLFTSNDWTRLVPTSWSIIPEALKVMMMYVSFHLPSAAAVATMGGSLSPYNPLQQITYFGVVFLLGPFMIATGAAMSPAIGARFPRYPKIFRGRQVARSLHFLGMIAFVLFIIIHITMVIVERFPRNMGNIVLGQSTNLATAIGLFALYVTIVIIIHVWVTGSSLRKPRAVQNKLGVVIEPAKRVLFRRLVSRQQYFKSEVTPYFRVNGYPADTQEYNNLVDNNFVDWKLRIYGLVENTLELSLSDLQTYFLKQTQITEHSCIQGWTAIAGWSGVSVRDVMTKCKPLPQARYLVFHSYQYTNGVEFYE